MLTKLFLEMTRHECGRPDAIAHFVKVHGYARQIALCEGLSEQQQTLTEAAALVHDIGIRPSLEKYGDAAGPLQEKEGAPLAKEMLLKVGFDERTAERVSFLVGHHHTYSAIDGIDYQILVEADFLVNLQEQKAGTEEVSSVRAKIFKTQSGTELLDRLFPGAGK